MQVAAEDFDQLLCEHAALLRAYGEAQVRCSGQLQAQAREIARLDAEAMRMRAALVVQASRLAWAQEDRAALVRDIPGLPRRLVLARQVEALQTRVRDLLDELQRRALRPAPVQAMARSAAGTSADDLHHLEADLAAADLVICQTGCLSHGAYWRVQDHCKRTGKACVLVEKSDALHIVRIRRAGEGEGAALVALQQD